MTIVWFGFASLELTLNMIKLVVGLKSRASEILNKKRKLTLEMVTLIHSSMNIPTEVLIQAY